MKILFLDVDGVLNSQDTMTKDPSAFFPIDAYMAFLVGRIQLNTGCQIVLSSSWRHNEESVSHIEKRVSQLFGMTPDLPGKSRGDEITEWLSHHPDVSNYAILDDDMDAGIGHGRHFFKTTFLNGLTTEIGEEVTQFLNRKQK